MTWMCDLSPTAPSLSAAAATQGLISTPPQVAAAFRLSSRSSANQPLSIPQPHPLTQEAGRRRQVAQGPVSQPLP